MQDSLYLSSYPTPLTLNYVIRLIQQHNHTSRAFSNPYKRDGFYYLLHHHQRKLPLRDSISSIQPPTSYPTVSNARLRRTDGSAWYWWIGECRWVCYAVGCKYHISLNDLLLSWKLAWQICDPEFPVGPIISFIDMCEPVSGSAQMHITAMRRVDAAAWGCDCKRILGRGLRCPLAMKIPCHVQDDLNSEELGGEYGLEVIERYDRLIGF